MKARLQQICTQVSEAIEDGARLIVLSQRGVTKDFAPIPSLLLTGAVHQYLVRQRTRTRVGPRRRGGRRPRGAPHRAAHRLRRRCGQPVSRDGHRRGPRHARRHPRRRLRDRREEPGQGAGQGRAQDHVQDRRVHGGLLHRRADLRGRRPGLRGGRHLLHRHHLAPGRRRLRRAGRGGPHPPPPGLPRRRDPRVAPRARGGRRVPVAARGRAAPVQPHHGVQAAALHPPGPVRDLQGVHARGRRAGPPAHDPARALPLQGRRAPAGRHRRGRAGRGHRQAVRHGRDLLRVDLQGDARDPGHRDEPHRRQVQHRRGRRGRRPLHPRRQRRLPAQRDQAGGVRPVRRHQRVPRQRRRPADQDQPGREARRGRPAARPEGLPVDREHPALHAGRRPDLTAAAPRHLLHRGHQAAHPRPQERQPGRTRARQAREPGRRRHGRRGRREGLLRRRAHLRARRRHRRLAAAARSSTRAGRGSSGWPRRSRPCCATACATGSWCRPTAS